MEQERSVLVPETERTGDDKHAEGTGSGSSPGTPGKEARPVQPPLSSSSRPESAKAKQRSRRRREADCYKDRTKAGGVGGKSSRTGEDGSRAKRSPLHQHAHHGKKANRVGSGSPSWDRKTGAEGPITPGRSRTRSADQHDQPTDQASAVPKFGDWNENDPSSGDGYTDIFDKVMEEKNKAKKAPMIITDPEFYPDYGARKSKGQGCSCFGWFRRR